MRRTRWRRGRGQRVFGVQGRGIRPNCPVDCGRKERRGGEIRPKHCLGARGRGGIPWAAPCRASFDGAPDRSAGEADRRNGAVRVWRSGLAVGVGLAGPQADAKKQRIRPNHDAGDNDSTAIGSRNRQSCRICRGRSGARTSCQVARNKLRQPSER